MAWRGARIVRRIWAGSGARFRLGNNNTDNSNKNNNNNNNNNSNKSNNKHLEQTFPGGLLIARVAPPPPAWRSRARVFAIRGPLECTRTISVQNVGPHLRPFVVYLADIARARQSCLEQNGPQRRRPRQVVSGKAKYANGTSTAATTTT